MDLLCSLFPSSKADHGVISMERRTPRAWGTGHWAWGEEEAGREGGTGGEEMGTPGSVQ